MARRRPNRSREKRYRKSLLIVCEGKNTEPLYFKQLVHRLRLGTTIEVQVIGDTPHTDPKGLLEDAIRLREQRAREAKKSNAVRPYDEVWIVFDTEWRGRYRGLPQAAGSMLNKAFHAAISNPSFEVWFILHDRRTPPACSCCDEAVAVLRKAHKELAGYGKSQRATQKCVNWSLAEGRLPRAIQHGRAQAEDSFSDAQPDLPTATATSVHRLVAVLVNACDDEPALQGLGFSADS